MTDRRWIHCVKGGVVLMALVASSMAQGAAPEKATVHRALRDMDTFELSESLRELQMTTLLRATAEASGNVPAIIDAIVFQADLAGAKDRDRYYAEAVELAKKDIELQRKRIRDAGDENPRQFDDATIAYYKNKLRYFQLQGVKRGQPYMSRIIYLVASDDDKKMLQELTGNTAEDLLKTERRLTSVLKNNQRGSKLVYLVPQLEDLQQQLKYTGALVKYSSALGMPARVAIKPSDPPAAPEPTEPPAEETATPSEAKPATQPVAVVMPKPTSKPNPVRTQRLEQAIEDLKLYANDPDMGVQPYANLWRARAYRELGQYEAAQEALAFTVGDQSIASVKVEGYFELARCAIEDSVKELETGTYAEAMTKLAEAKKATDLFAKEALAIAGEEAALGVDFKKLNLGSYMYEEWIRTLRKKGLDGEAAAMVKESSGPFNEFYEKYGDNPRAIMAAVVFLRDKFEGRDPMEMPAMVLVLLAQLELREAQDLQKNGSTPESDAKLTKAKGMFEAVLARDDEASKAAHPDALWGMGNAYILLRENFKAADQFNLLVERFPQHARARDAGINAVQITATLISQWREEKPNAPIPVERLKKYRDALLTILTHWGDDARASEYWHHLGFCYDELSEREQTDAGRDKLLTESIACYQKVPAGSENALEAGYINLDIQYRMLQGKPVDATTKALARTLMGNMLAYAMKVKPVVQSETDAARKKQLGQWGATTAFHAEVLRYEYLDDEASALARVQTLAEKWPGTRAMLDSRIFLIRKLLSRGQVARGVDEFEKFQTKYGDTQAQVLMRDVVETLKRTIDELVGNDDQQEALASFRKAYLDFAKQVYDSKKDSPNKSERDSVTMLYGDALVQSGDSANGVIALTLFEPLKKEQDESKKAKVAAIAAKIKGYVDTVKSAPDDANRIRILKGEFEKNLEALGLDKWSGFSRVSLGTAFKRLNSKDLKPKDVVNACKTAKYRLTRAYGSAQKTLSLRVEVNANVIRGLARAYMLTGQNAKAIPYLRRLIAGLNATTHRTMYWECQLDMVKAQYEVNKDDPKRLGILRASIKQLRDRDPSMGGARFLGQFNGVDAKASQRTDS
jgi:tetratricopeptide (TPR) repeat protein